MPVKPAQNAYDIHLFTNRFGKRSISVTLPNGKRTKRLQLSKLHERILLELLALVRVYDPTAFEPQESAATADATVEEADKADRHDQMAEEVP